MGRAVDVDKRLDALEMKVNEVLLMLDEFAQTNTTKENIDIHEATKQKETNDEGNGKSSGKSNSGKSKSKNRATSNSASSK
tara:strand:- start:479 stop:721 length:243 start_codon:yes stop_codon:yes gene_type:complete